MSCPKCQNPIYSTMGFEDLLIRGKPGRWYILQCPACGAMWLQEQTKTSRKEKNNGRIRQTSLAR
ncbi:MAG: hypothetical protein ACP5I1_16245 [Candidatus Hinthialibacter sp.]